jgi:hypothetical protein
MTLPAVRQSPHDLVLTYQPDSNRVELVDPDSGEAIALEAAGAPLVASVLRVVELELDELRDMKRWLAREMLARMDRSTTWTVRARGVEVTAPSPAVTYNWDVTKLVPILDQLVEEGVIDREAATRACEPRTEYHVLLRGIDAISRLPGVADRLAVARSEAPAKDRSVRVAINRGGE